MLSTLYNLKIIRKTLLDSLILGSRDKEEMRTANYHFDSNIPDNLVDNGTENINKLVHIKILKTDIRKEYKKVLI